MEAIKEKLCVIQYNGVIKELGGISGPILSPHKYPINKVISMVNSGIPVYEVNPYDRNDRIRLTRSTVKSVNFPLIRKKINNESNKSSVQSFSDRNKKHANTEKVTSTDFNNVK